MIQDKVKLINTVSNYLDSYLKKSGMNGFIFQGDIFRNETFFLIDVLRSKNFKFEILFVANGDNFISTGIPVKIIRSKICY